jgi:predicted ATPase
MINKISFKNYKVFKEKQTLELRPITILIGKNNSGKSAVLKLPTLISGSLSGKFSHPFELENEGVRIANEYRDVVYGRTFKELELELFQKKYLSDNIDFLKAKIYINDNEQIIESWNCNNLINLFKQEEDNYHNEKTDEVHETHFEGINLKTIEIVNELPTQASLDLPSFKIITDFIGDIRQESKLNYPYSSNIQEKSSSDGSNLYQFLIEDYLTTDKKYFTQVSNWINEKFEGWELKIEVDGYKKEIPAIIELENKNLKINISQTGMGICQVLPLIIRAFRPCKEETLIIVEEPESHLHPYAHAQVAQLFFESLESDKNKKYLIETHSQNFVLRMRRLVAEGHLKAEDLAIYYVDFDEEKNESELQQIEVDNGGGVDMWPDNVFGESVLEARAIMNANINDLRNVD